MSLEELLEQGDIETLSKFQTKIYWEEKDLVKMVSTTQKILNTIQGGGKDPFLYNLASFTCPWWSDSLPVNQTEAETGMNAALELLELRQSQKTPDTKLAGANWILAVHYLYTERNSKEAISHFQESIKLVKNNTDEFSKLVNANSIEGIGRVKVLLHKEDHPEELESARNAYIASNDEYSLKELEYFLQKTS